ncbi:Methionine gamma-lyase [Hibiscus syriacus]|uniref:Methionine gamma-lyase n=1 Tax=Hibiscus syriacus TaxID=106335 RepID=A0A6A3BMD9_HIBSY|nr:Methionine gamma-lyase [Hibiscus syriacus]
MAGTQIGDFFSWKKRAAGDDVLLAKKSLFQTLAAAVSPARDNDHAAALASVRREFGEHGGVNMSIDPSATFTVMEPETMRCMFTGELGPDRDFFIYSHHFNPTVLNLSRQLAALEGTEAAYCAATFISGGADVIAGAVCGPASLVNSMMDLHQGALMLLGPTMNAKIHGIRYSNELGLRVVYPGLEDHPQHQLLNSMANKGYGFGGLLCVDMESEANANRLMHHLQNSSQFGLIAVSLGYYETLMSCSASSTSNELNDKEKTLAGISPGLLRMSIGYTGTLEQKWSQFEKPSLG